MPVIVYGTEIGTLMLPPELIVIPSMMVSVPPACKESWVRPVDDPIVNDFTVVGAEGPITLSPPLGVMTTLRDEFGITCKSQFPAVSKLPLEGDVQMIVVGGGIWETRNPMKSNSSIIVAQVR